jgi:hypothetical protein
MKSLAEVARDLNAIKQERSHSRVVVPSTVQEDENFRMIADLLHGTGIDQAELAGLSLEVAASGVSAVAAMDGGIDGNELLALIGSLWIDGVILGCRYSTQGQRIVPPETQDNDDFATWLEPLLPQLRSGELDIVPAIRPPAFREAADGLNGSHSASGSDPSREGAQDDPRGERDR